MIFAEPYWLLLLLGLLPLAWLRRKHGEPSAFVYSSVRLVKGIRGVTRSAASRILPKLRWIALALFIVALARPQVGQGEAPLKASGVDIVVALDLSGTMAAEDFEKDGRPVNRVNLAKQVLARFIEKRTSDRIGLVAFAGQAYIAAPLTLDHDYLLANMERLELGLIEDGTAIGSALSASLNRLRDVDSKSKIVILMTDGQNNAGQVPPLTAADAAEALGVKVYTIGVGTRGTARMPQTDLFGRRVYRDMEVDIDEDTLQQIAERTGGRYFRATDSAALEKIYDEIDRLEKTEIEVRRHLEYHELFHWLVLPGMFLVILETILRQTVWRKLP